MKALSPPDTLRFGDWRAHPASGELLGPAGAQRLEPKVMELLQLLAAEPGRVWSREALMQRLWPRQPAADDSLARSIFKLRKALGDDARTPRYVETLPKRGYRFIGASAGAPVEAAAAAVEVAAEEPDGTTAPLPPRRAAWLALVAVLVMAVLLALLLRQAAPPVPIASAATTLTEHANDFYFQYSRLDNEAAVELFERVLRQHPDHAPALAGLANALVQRVIRWPHAPGQGLEYTRLGDALAHGHTRTPAAQAELARALQLATRAVQLAPADAAAHKALGFVRSARAEFDAALAAYRRAVELDPDAWGPLVNIGDLLEIQGQPGQALPYFEAAFAAMTRVYPRQSARLRPWYAATALLVAGRHRAGHDPAQAETWYRRVLEINPLHATASARLAALLVQGGRDMEAAKLCAHLRDAGVEGECPEGAGP